MHSSTCPAVTSFFEFPVNGAFVVQRLEAFHHLALFFPAGWVRRYSSTAPPTPETRLPWGLSGASAAPPRRTLQRLPAWSCPASRCPVETDALALGAEVALLGDSAHRPGGRIRHPLFRCPLRRMPLQPRAPFAAAFPGESAEMRVAVAVRMRSKRRTTRPMSCLAFSFAPALRRARYRPTIRRTFWPRWRSSWRTTAITASVSASPSNKSIGLCTMAKFGTRTRGDVDRLAGGHARMRAFCGQIHH